MTRPTRRLVAAYAIALAIYSASPPFVMHWVPAQYDDAVACTLYLPMILALEATGTTASYNVYCNEVERQLDWCVKYVTSSSSRKLSNT